MSGQIIGSGRLNVTVQNHGGPLATPATLQIPVADGVKVLTFGGLTKLEALAGQIVGHVKCPETAVSLAQSVLDECQRKQASQPTS